MDEHTITVHAIWDDEAGVYVATSDDVPGLVAEAADMPALRAKLDVLIPELLELNGGMPARWAGRDVPLVLELRQLGTIRLPA